MNLLCPNCQKMVMVDEQYAGQLVKCPLCAGTFTVPALAPTAPPAQPPAPGGYSFAPPGPAPAAPPQPEPAPAAPTAAAPGPEPLDRAAAAPPAGYRHTATVWLSPRVLPW